MSVGILFPGQGSQTVGMGADLFDAREDLLGDRADEILGFSLRTLCLEGPEEELTRTQHAQPALFALSYALWEMVGRREPSDPWRARPDIHWGSTPPSPRPGSSTSTPPSVSWR